MARQVDRDWGFQHIFGLYFLSFHWCKVSSEVGVEWWLWAAGFRALGVRALGDE